MSVSPVRYPMHGGFPFLNLARWHGIPYDRILNKDKLLPEFVQFEIKEIERREEKRRQGVFGPMPYQSV